MLLERVVRFTFQNHVELVLVAVTVLVLADTVTGADLLQNFVQPGTGLTANVTHHANGGSQTDALARAESFSDLLCVRSKMFLEIMVKSRNFNIYSILKLHNVYNFFLHIGQLASGFFFHSSKHPLQNTCPQWVIWIVALVTRS